VVDSFPKTTSTSLKTVYALTSYPVAPPSLPSPVILSDYGEGSVRISFDFGSTTPTSYSISTATRVSGIAAAGASGNFWHGSALPSKFRLLRNAAASGATDSAFAFQYASAALWQDDDVSKIYESAHLFGFETLSGAVPQSGTRTLQGRVIGRYIAAAQPNGPSSQVDIDGTATVTVNFATRQVRLQMNIPQRPGAYDVNFTIAAGTVRFQGGLGGVSGLLSGSVRGSLFGPTAEEVGIAFGLSGSDQVGEERIVGVVLAK
jgi:hypothetical protein